MISTSSMLTVNLFFNSSIKLLTKISGADAPDDIPMVLHLSISWNGVVLSEWIKVDFSQPEFFATSTSLTEFDEFLLPIQKTFHRILQYS